MANFPLAVDTAGRVWVERTLANMSLEQKVGQVFIADFVGVYCARDSENMRRIERLIREYHIGGVILAGGAVLDVALATNLLQEMSTIPLLVNADIERGLNFRNPWHFVRGRAEDLPRYVPGGGTEFPRQMALGAVDDADTVYAMAQIIGRECRAIGIHWINAPVLDVNTRRKNPIVNARAFGDKPELVARLGAAYVRGLQDAGVIAAGKHFPGHGDTIDDTHMTLPVVAHGRARLDAVELLPFRRAIAAGVGSMMIAHIAYPALGSPQMPASLSRAVITDFLRGELDFGGIVVTDGLPMQAISDRFSPEEAAVAAIAAGGDCLLVPNQVAKSHAALVEAVTSGKIPAQQLDDSVRRILLAKAALGLHRERQVDLTAIAEVVGAAAHAAFAEKVCRSAVTRVAGTGTVRLKSNVALVLISESLRQMKGVFLEKALGNRYTLRRVEQIAEPACCGDPVGLAGEIAAGADTVILAFYYSIGAWKGQTGLPAHVQKFITALSASSGHDGIIAVSFGDPYLLADLPPGWTKFAAYSDDKNMEEAFVHVLAEGKAVGKLPVEL